jgi:hypothetical protein
MLLQRIHNVIILACILFILVILAGMVEVADALNITPVSGALPAGTVSAPYSTTLTGAGGPLPYSWQITLGSLPPGLSLSPAGNPAAISGTPMTAGNYSFDVTLIDKVGHTAVNSYTLAISATACSFVGGISTGAISFSSIDPSLAGPVFGAVTQQVSFTCNVSPVAYTVTVNPASGWTLQSGSNTIPYTLGIAPSGTYAGTAVNLLIPSGGGASSIIQANYQNAPAGTYANAAAITITVAYGGASPLTATVPIGAVTGTVINTCMVAQAPGTLTFNIDPSVTGTTSASISPDMQIKCTYGGSVSISATSTNGGASPRLNCSSASCGSAQIPYTFKILNSNIWPVGALGQGFGGTGTSLGISGSVNSVDYVNAPVGTYADIETITISY